MRLLRYAPLVALDWLYVGLRQIQKLVSRDDASRYLNPGKPHAIPVIIIPGIYEPWQFMKPVIEALFQRGHPVHVLDGLGYNTGTIPAMAEIVRRYLDATPLQQAVIVAHSKGGLIGKYFLANCNHDGQVRTLVAINTPFSGSVYARYLPIPGVGMFAPTAQYIRELLENQALNASVTSIYSAYDPNIPGGSRLEGATNVVIDTVGHFRIVNDQAAHQAVIAAVQTVATRS
jgi:triacylglycerol lipase